MANDVDDIFKSFVTDKLKQFGMNGMPNAAETLEESLKKSALGSRPLHQSKESPTKPMDINDLAKKLKKLKKRKHKEEKREKKRKRKKEKKEEKERDEKTAQDYEVKSLKKKLLLDEKEESKIKKKKLNSYNETVSKIKEIESLPLSEKKVEIMPQNNVENLTKESTVVNTENKVDVTPIAELKNLSNGISRTLDTC
uniref:Uncharacterized protein n=1 Tax=Ciona savignyi TaxID=51511 RepID=H2Z0D7_CIOSA